MNKPMALNIPCHLKYQPLIPRFSYCSTYEATTFTIQLSFVVIPPLCSTELHWREVWYKDAWVVLSQTSAMKRKITSRMSFTRSEFPKLNFATWNSSKGLIENWFECKTRMSMYYLPSSSHQIRKHLWLIHIEKFTRERTSHCWQPSRNYGFIEEETIFFIILSSKASSKHRIVWLNVTEKLHAFCCLIVLWM